MCEVRIRGVGEKPCDECGRTRKGVAFRIGLGVVGDEPFLCWEHFRLLQAAMKPGRVVIVERVSVCGHSCCCRHSTPRAFRNLRQTNIASSPPSTGHMIAALRCKSFQPKSVKSYADSFEGFLPPRAASVR